MICLINLVLHHIATSITLVVFRMRAEVRSRRRLFSFVDVCVSPFVLFCVFLCESWCCLCRRLLRQREPYVARGAQWYGPVPTYCKVCISSGLLFCSFRPSIYAQAHPVLDTFATAAPLFFFCLRERPRLKRCSLTGSEVSKRLGD